MGRLRLTLAIVGLAILVSPLDGFTQQTMYATLGGIVSDASGALVPGVEVTARNVATGILSTVLTNETGSYQFTTLQTGTYEVSASLSGFQKAIYNNVVLGGGGQQVRLDFTLQVAAADTKVEIVFAADTALAATSASIGTALNENLVRDLPLGSRDVLELLGGLPGTGPTEGTTDGNFAGNRLTAVNVTRDGMTVTTGRYAQGTLSATFMSPDLVEEVKVVVAPVGGEGTRGSGQVQFVTRSGSNQFRGSAFWTNRNSVLDAANWFSNFNQAEEDWENRNQYGVRLGGPIIRNKTFFFFLIDNQRTAIRENFVGTVLTEPARQGIFRYFPGADNRNAQQIDPTVDLQGNPVRPPSATGDLQSINVFAQDPLRPGFDPSGWTQNVLLARMPAPKDYTVGDGLNTAGIRFTRRIYGFDQVLQDVVDRNNRDQVNVRVDHHFNASHRLSFIGTWENSRNRSASSGLEQWPGGYQGANHKFPRIYSFSLLSTLTPNLVNEFRTNWRLHDVRSWGPLYVGRDRDKGDGDPIAQEVFALFPKYNGLPLQVSSLLGYANAFGLDNGFGTTRGSYSPLLTFSDNVSWTRGRHAFRTGFELRRDRTEGWNDNNFTPFAQIGPGNQPAPITNLTIPGLTSTNAANARNLLYNLSGSIDFIRQAFDLRSSEPPLRFLGYQDGVKLKNRDWRVTEFSIFFKDEWKAARNLTLNLSLTWDYYGVPYEANGLAGRVVNGFQGLCGIGCGGLTTVELVGKNSPQPDKQLFNDDWNNFAPAVGFSWSIPGLGRTTILRAGYGISYSGGQFQGAMGIGGIDSGAGQLPGLAGISPTGGGLEYRQTSFWSLANVVLPFQPQFEPLSPVPLNGTRALTMNMYEPDRPVPYIQNFNLSIQRELARNLLLDISYVGSKATKLYGRTELNYQKIFETEFLDAFNVTRAGGNHPLFDAMLMGLNVPGVGVVNGTTITGSSALRRWTSTQTNVANGDAGAVAGFLNTTTLITGEGGGLIRNAGLPEDYLVFNPQFLTVGLNGNPSNSTHHSLQVQVTKRLSQGFTNQTSYTWSKSLGEAAGDGTVNARDPRNRAHDKAVLTFHRTHIITSNGTYALPFGPNRAMLNAGPTWVQKLVENWQLGGIFRWSSGAPLSFTTGSAATGVLGANVWSSGDTAFSPPSNTPHLLGKLPKGKVTKRTDGSLPTYFAGLTQVTDPVGRAEVTNVNALADAYSKRAIMDADGNRLLVNPSPGEVGSLGIRIIEGPARFQLDMSLQKRVSIDESRSMEIRVDTVNILNKPVWGNPNLNINSPNFGLINSADPGRRFTFGARLNF